jgi:hypothetical protein
MRRVKRDVARLGLDVSHFKATRTWDDAQLKRAIAEALSWDDVHAALGLRTQTKGTRVRLHGHAIRLGLDLRHLEIQSAQVWHPREWQVDPVRLREAATPLAAAWFIMRGCIVSLPTEQAVYDLLVHAPEGMSRVQVKTTTTTGPKAQVNVGRRPYTAGNLGPLLPYDPKVIDYFFIVDGDCNIYLVPSRVVAGRVGLMLRTYKEYIVGDVSGLLGAAPKTAGARAPVVALGACPGPRLTFRGGLTERRKRDG